MLVRDKALTVRQACRALILVILVATSVAYASGTECSVEVYFVSPSTDGVIEEQLINAINQAQDSLYIALYAFTDDELGQAVQSAFERGVQVRVLLHSNQENAVGGECERLVEKAGVPVYIKRGGGLFHHKFAIIDLQMVVTGSYNWSDSADDNNYENVVFIYSSEIACEYYQEFSDLMERYTFERVGKENSEKP